MTYDDLLRLKSGTDIRGIAVDTSDGPATLTEERGRALGAAFIAWLSQYLDCAADTLTVAVGRDSRISGPGLQRAIMDGMLASHAQVLDCGLSTTPAMYLSTVLMQCDGAVMVTASHLPWQRNGYKFFTHSGGLSGTDIESLLHWVAEMPGNALQDMKIDTLAQPCDYLPVYTDHLVQKIHAALPGNHPLSGLHVVVDAGNGSGGFYADMLQSLGADIQGSQFLVPDGRFPNHIPNPEAPEAMASLTRAVQDSGADLGVLLDADCDRAALVAAGGRPLNRNRLIALVSAMLLEESPGITVVTDSVTSAGLDRFLAAHGGVLHRYKRGYRNVIDEAIRLNRDGVDCPLAMETSGHAALRENRFLDDGMYLATRLIIQAQKLRARGDTLEGMIADLQEPVEALEVRIAIIAKDFQEVGRRVIARMLHFAQQQTGATVDERNREGVRIEFEGPDRWLLLRASLHDPQLVVNVESDVKGGIQPMLQFLYNSLSAQSELDLSTLSAHINNN